jgi:hypothetical protein
MNVHGLVTVPVAVIFADLSLHGKLLLLKSYPAERV